MLNTDLLRIISLTLNNQDWCNFRLTCKLSYQSTNMYPQDLAARKLTCKFKQHLNASKLEKGIKRIRYYFNNGIRFRLRYRDNDKRVYTHHIHMAPHRDTLLYNQIQYYYRYKQQQIMKYITIMNDSKYFNIHLCKNYTK